MRWLLAEAFGLDGMDSRLRGNDKEGLTAGEKGKEKRSFTREKGTH
jgi:hypothetical protein